MAFTVTVMGCMGCNSVCRCDVERCCLYPADYCTEWTESDAGIYDHESGICIFSTCRLGDPWRGVDCPPAPWLPVDLYCDYLRTDPSRGEERSIKQF